MVRIILLLSIFSVFAFGEEAYIIKKIEKKNGDIETIYIYKNQKVGIKEESDLIKDIPLIKEKLIKTNRCVCEDCDCDNCQCKAGKKCDDNGCKILPVLDKVIVNGKYYDVTAYTPEVVAWLKANNAYSLKNNNLNFQMPNYSNLNFQMPSSGSCQSGNCR